MATDDERRRVAARLRAAKGPSLMMLMEVLGVGGREIKRAKAIGNVAAQINASRANSLRAAQFMDQAYDAHPQLPFEVK